MSKRIAVIGAGYAGLAAAVTLVGAGQQVTVFETSKTLGGRARKVELDGYTFDNGQHILIGAYAETLRLLKQIGVDSELALRRLPLTLTYPDFHLRTPRLPAPLHLLLALLTARGLAWNEKFAAIRFMRWLKKRHFCLDADTTVSALLDAHQQPASLRRYLWEPLCISALNTAAEHASAQVFANVLRDSLAADRAASDLLLPRVHLSALFAEPAAAYVEANGGSVRTGRAISSIRHENGLFYLDDGDDAYTHVIAAVAPYHLPRLLAGLPGLETLIAQVEAFKWEPIVTCYLRYPAGTRLPQVMQGLSGGYVHWIFDRGQLDGNDGVFAAVISASGQHRNLSQAELADAVHAELTAIHPWLPAPLVSQVITEKRATFACAPNLQRPGTRTALLGLLLAGDYVVSDYPATIEGAICNGIQAAKTVVLMNPA